MSLLKTAVVLLKQEGKIGVIHWRYDNTPRGPSMEIRPVPDKIIAWAEMAGMRLMKQVDLKPYHYRLILCK